MYVLSTPLARNKASNRGPLDGQLYMAGNQQNQVPPSGAGLASMGMARSVYCRNSSTPISNPWPGRARLGAGGIGVDERRISTGKNKRLDSPFACSTGSSNGNANETSHETILKEYESMLARLPGLHRSPELVERVSELANMAASLKTPPNKISSISASSITTRTPKLGLSPLVAGIATEDEADLIWCVALVLLTIPPPIRRRLHFLIRFMQRICKNHCLRLDSTRENRYVVLERLSESVISESNLINSTKCLHLVTFLVDNENDLFSIPATFKSDVEQLISMKFNYTANKENDGSNNKAEMVQYCERIKPNEYVEQKEKGIEEHLLALLDEIINNENISIDQRKKQLKKFKKTYPHIYEIRFPSPKMKSQKPRTPGFFGRLRSFNFR